MSRAGKPATRVVPVLDSRGQHLQVSLAEERALTLFLDKRELVTLMTLGDDPEHLVLGWLLNQRLIDAPDALAAIQVDWTVGAAAITSRMLQDRQTTLWESAQGADLQAHTGQRIVTTGCGQGSLYADLLHSLAPLNRPGQLRESQLQQMLALVRDQQTLYREAGAVHGCALLQCPANQAPVLLRFVEDVGRHNAVDAIAGWMALHPEHRQNTAELAFFTTGRLTSEMVLKCAQMQIGVLVSRSGATALGYELAGQTGMLMVARAQGQHYLVMQGADRFIQDAPPASPARQDITGVLLAGGLSRRMSPEQPKPSSENQQHHPHAEIPLNPSPDKGLLDFQGEPLAASVLRRLQPQVGPVLINANRNLEAWAQFMHPVLPDRREGFAGPLAGLETALQSASTPWVLTVPCDGPCLPEDLVDRLAAAAVRAQVLVASARTATQSHPVYMLVRRDALSSLTKFLDDGRRRIDAWTATLPHVEVVFPDEAAFANLNTPEDFARVRPE
jgi:FdhD protein